MDYDVEGALKAGVTPTSIVDYLAEKKGYDLEGARDAGLSDDVLLEHLSGYKAPAPPAEPRSLIKEVPIQAYAGATIDLPKQIGQAMQWMSKPGDWAHEQGKAITDWADTREKENPDLAPQTEGRGLIGRALSGGARALAPSVSVMAPAALGAMAAPVVGAGALVGAGVGAAAGAFGLFGASQAQDTYDKLLKSGVPEPEAREAGWINLAIEGGGETLGDIAGLKLFGMLGKAVVKGATPVAGAIANATDNAVIAPFLKQLPKTAATEIATEFGQNFGEAWVENKYGAANPEQNNPFEQGKQGAEAALGMTLLLAPFGLAGFAQKAKRNERVANALENPDAPVPERIAASKILFNEIHDVNPEAAQAWSQNSSFAIATQSPILLDEKTAQPGLHWGGPGQPASLQERMADDANARIVAIDKATNVDEAIAAATAAPAAIDVGAAVKTEVDSALAGRQVLEAMEKRAQEEESFAEQEKQNLLGKIQRGQGAGLIGQKLREAAGIPVTEAEPIPDSPFATTPPPFVPPKTVAGKPQESATTEELQALAEDPGTPPITRHAAVAALSARTAQEAAQATPEAAVAAPAKPAASVVPAQPAPAVALESAPQVPSVAAPSVAVQPVVAGTESVQPNVAPSVADIHALAQSKAIPNDPAFAAFTKELTGREHLDALSPEQRQVVYDGLKARPDVKPVTFLGKPLADHTDKALETALKGGKSPELRQAAQGELDRRKSEAVASAAPHAAILTQMATEAGWAQEGGKLMRDVAGASREEIAAGWAPQVGNVTGRTTWIPNQPWFAGMRKDLGSGGLSTKLEIGKAVEDYLAGKKLSASAKRTIDWMIKDAESEQAFQEREQAGRAAAEQDIVDSVGDNWSKMTEDEKENELDKLFGEASRPSAGNAETPAPGTQGEAGQAVSRPALDLAQQSNEEAAAEASRLKAIEDDKAKADAKAESDAKQARVAAEIKSRQAASAENFELGQSAEDSLAGQGDVFSKPAAEMSAADHLLAAADKMEGKAADSFSVERLVDGEMKSVTFTRGEYVKALISGSGDTAKWNAGEITGISQAKRQAKVGDGDLWYGFGSIYPAERPAVAKKPTVPLSSVIDKANAKFGAGLTEADRVPGTRAPAETFSGQYGKGLNEQPARQQQKRLTAERPELTWKVEPSDKYEHPFVVNGYANPKFSRGGIQSSDPLLQAWNELAKHDEAYRYVESDKKDLSGIVADIDPALKVTPTTGSSKILHIWYIEDPDGGTVLLKHYKDGSVELDAASLKESQRGSIYYHIAANYAFNNGLVFNGDRMGVSDIAVRRRTENLLSSALRFGTTRHLGISDELSAPKEAGVRPIDWKAGDDAHNLRELLLTSYENVANSVPQIKEISYNFDDGRFEQNGKPFTDDDFDILSQSGGARESGAGSTTLKRAAITGALVRGTGAQRSEILDSLREQRAQTGLAEGLKRVLYSRGQSKSTGISETTLRDEISKAFGPKVADRLIGKVITPLADQSQLPAHVVPYARKGDTVYGFYDPKTDKTYAVLSNLSAADIHGLVLHEVGVHYGFKELLGEKNYASALKQLDMMRRAGNREVEAAYKEAEANAASESMIPEEALAYVIQNHPDMPTVQRIIAWIKAKLFELTGIGNLNVNDMAMLARSAVMRAGIEAGSNASPMATAFSIKYARGNMGTKKVGDIFNALVAKLGKDDVGALLYNWNESELNEDGDKIIQYVGRDREFSRGKEGGKVATGKAQFIEWLMGDGPYDTTVYGEKIRDDKEWGAQVEAARDVIRTFSPSNPDIRFSRGAQDAAAQSAPEWVKSQPAAMQETLRKAGAWRPKQTIKERYEGWTADWQQKLKQGMFDQFDPIKSLSYRAYMLARMSKSSAGPLETTLLNGTVFLDKDGAVDVNYEKGGFIARMQALKGEHDRFFSWVIGNRAERLMAEGKEHNFTADDIARLKTLNQGEMDGGGSRATAYAQALMDLNRYNRSIVDMAVKAGLIDPESRPFWEKEFYIPFYRMTEGDTIKGPVKSGGLVRQYAFKTLKGGTEAIGDPMENIIRNWAHLIDASMKNNAAVAALDAAVHAGVARQTTAEEKGAVFVMKNGEKTYYAVEDPFVLDAINSLGFSGFSGPAMKVMSSFKRWLTYGVTIAPPFRIRNVIRDSISMIGTNPASYNVLSNVLTGWKMTKEGSEPYASMIAGGGVIRFGTLEKDGAANVKRLVDAGVDSDTILDTKAKTKAMLQHAYDWWMHVGDRSENMNRAALYQKLRDDGKSHLEASYAARDTMDFSMMGTWSAIRFLTQTVPFFNARLQGMYKLGRGAAEDPRRFAYVVGATALASIALLLAYGDDDDWKQREDWDRETYWWFKIGGKAFRIPKPFEIGALGTLAERGVEMMTSNELTGKQFIQRMGSVVGQQLSMNPVPQLFMPMIETWANRSTFTGRPIESMGMEKLSSPERIGPSTSAFAQLAGKNGVVSPVQIDHLINGYFGWLGMHAVATADLALRPIMSLPSKPAARIDEMFVLGDFVKDLPAYQSKYLTRLYDQGKEVQEAMADLRAFQKIGATEKAAEILKDQGDKIRLYQIYAHAEKQLSHINQQIKMVQGREGDADVKRERLDQLYAVRNRVAKITEERAQQTR